MSIALEPRVHTQQTKIQSDPIESYGESLRHSCSVEFLAAERVYAWLDDRKEKTRAHRLNSCRSLSWFYRHVDTGEVRVGSNSCHLRWCPICSASKRNHITKEVGEWLPKQDHPKFLTLTLRHSNAPLTFQVDCLYKAFRELRRRKEFDKCVTGGIWFFQIKISKRDGLWHPHLHCLITGLYLSKHKLHRMWSQVTGGSFVADIRAVDDPQKAANDAARYAAKPGSLSGLSLYESCELVDAVNGRRICGTWGTGRTVSLRPAKPKDKDKWQNVGGWFTVMRELDLNPNARAIIHAWKTSQPLTEGISCVLSIDAVDEAIHKMLLNFTFDEMFNGERDPP